MTKELLNKLRTIRWLAYDRTKKYDKNKLNEIVPNADWTDTFDVLNEVIMEEEKSNEQIHNNI